MNKNAGNADEVTWEINGTQLIMKTQPLDPTKREIIDVTLTDIFEDDEREKAACIITYKYFKATIYKISNTDKDNVVVSEKTFNRYIKENHLEFRATKKQIIAHEGDTIIINPPPADGKCELCGKKGTLKKCYTEDDEGIIVPCWKCADCLKSAHLTSSNKAVMQILNIQDPKN